MGHATADASISARLRSSKTTFVSYADGYNVLRRLGLPCIDLGLPADNAYLDTMLAAFNVLTKHRPAVVIAREEFSVLPIASALNIPSIFVSDWLPPSNHIGSESLKYSNRCFIFENEGIFPTPKFMRCAPEYFGPIRAPVKAHVDRQKMRKRLRISENCKMILVVPGGWFDEQRAPISDLLFSAFRSLKIKDKIMIWISRSDYLLFGSKVGSHSGVRFLGYVPNIYDYIGASDVIITKGTRGTTMDSASLGIPSIALSFGQNPVDELVIPRIRTNTHLYAKCISSDGLAMTIARVLGEPKPAPIIWQDDAQAAVAIDNAVKQLTSG